MVPSTLDDRLLKRNLAILCGLVLSGCATDSGAPAHLEAWDGRLPVRTLHEGLPSASSRADTMIATQQARLNSYERYSPEWRASKKELDDLEEGRIAKAMSICRGC
jgi:hypothetical protein